jgi:hypothetical protein
MGVLGVAFRKGHGRPRGYFRLERCRVNPIRVETLHDDLRLVRETLDGSTINDYVGRCDRFALIQLPDMQLVDGFDSRNLT